MPAQPSEIDRTGMKLEIDARLVGTEVVSRSKDGKIYTLKDYVKSDPDMMSGIYFVSAEQLEIMIVGVETGFWLESVASVD